MKNNRLQELATAIIASVTPENLRELDHRELIHLRDVLVIASAAAQAECKHRKVGKVVTNANR